jgi:hypothetical protein
MSKRLQAADEDVGGHELDPRRPRLSTSSLDPSSLRPQRNTYDGDTTTAHYPPQPAPPACPSSHPLSSDSVDTAAVPSPRLPTSPPAARGLSPRVRSSMPSMEIHRWSYEAIPTLSVLSRKEK